MKITIYEMTTTRFGTYSVPKQIEISACPKCGGELVHSRTRFQKPGKWEGEVKCSGSSCEFWNTDASDTWTPSEAECLAYSEVVHAESERIREFNLTQQGQAIINNSAKAERILNRGDRDDMGVLASHTGHPEGE